MLFNALVLILLTKFVQKSTTRRFDARLVQNSTKKSTICTIALKKIEANIIMCQKGAGTKKKNV